MLPIAELLLKETLMLESLQYVLRNNLKLQFHIEKYISIKIILTTNTVAKISQKPGKMYIQILKHKSVTYKYV